MQEATFSHLANLPQPSLAVSLGWMASPISSLSFAQDPGKGAPRSSHNPEDSREILPPGKLHREDGDSALTGITRSLQRRLLGLRDLARGRSNSPSDPPEKIKKLD
jgi:hypothetical protein